MPLAGEAINEQRLNYMNRLSDLPFVMACVANCRENGRKTLNGIRNNNLKSSFHCFNLPREENVG